MKKRSFIVTIAALVVAAGDISHPNLTYQADLNRLFKNTYSEPYTSPKGAIEQEFRMTRSPELGYPPSELRIAAFEEAKTRLAEKGSGGPSLKTLQANWEERGPVNVGGRTRAVMFDPNDPTARTVWAGGVAGGIWSNTDITDISSSWTNVDDFMANLAVTTMAYDPTNTMVFYAGTGEGWFNIDAIRGAGIFKSTDGGSSWQQLQSTIDERFDFVQKVVVTGNGTILAAVTSFFANVEGIHRSTDGGATWVREIAGRGADIEIAPDGTIYATTGIFNPGVMHRSTDDGDTWTELTGDPSNVERIELAVSDSDANVLYAAGSNEGDLVWLARSDNAGAAWTNLSIPTTILQSCQASSENMGGGQAWYDLILRVHPTDPATVIIGAIDLYKSTDSGVTFDQISYWTGGCFAFVHADQHAVVFRPGKPDEGIIGNDGGLFYSANLGSVASPAFTTLNRDYNVTQFYSLALENESGSNYMLGGTQDNGTHRFESAGLNTTTEVNGGDGGFCFIDQTDGVIQVSSYLGNHYFLSTNSGASFNTISDDSDEGLFINPTEYDEGSKTIFAASGADQFNAYTNLSGNVQKQTYQFPGIGQVTHLKASPFTQDRLFLGTDASGVFRVENADTDPELYDITGNLAPLSYISSIAIGESDDHLLVTFSNYNVPSVFETLDGGVTWQNKEGDLPDMPVRWSMYDPANYRSAILATDVGIWITTDLDQSPPQWVPENDGLANVRTDMIKMRRSDGKVGVATHGRGIFTSDIFSAPVADFSLSQSPVGYAGDNTFEFQDLSVNASQMWSWDFGDGNDDLIQNPTHTFTESGYFDVSLTIGGGMSSKIKTGFVKVLPEYSPTYSLVKGGDFESNVEDFAAHSQSGSSFSLGNSSVVGKDGVVSGATAWVLGPTENQHQPNTLAFLYTPAFNLSNSGPYTLEFMTKYDLELGFDGFVVEVSTDRGETWDKLNNMLLAGSWYNAEANPTNRFYEPNEPFFSGTTNGFVSKSVDISDFEGNESVAFRFVFRSDETVEQAGLVIDDFILTGTTTVQFVADVNTVCENEAVVFTDESSGDITEYSWDFGEGAQPATATSIGPHQVSYSTPGQKTVVLTVNGTLVETKQDFINVVALPLEIMAGASTEIVCFGEDVTINLSDLEEGIAYTITNDTSGDLIASFVHAGPETTRDLALLGLTADIPIKITAVEPINQCEIDFGNVINITVQALPEPTATLDIDGNLVASLGDAYQWFHNGEPVEGATNQVHEPQLLGIYYVDVTQDGCVGRSNNVEVIVVGLEDNLVQARILELYPNPVSRLLKVQLNEHHGWAHFQILNLNGQKMKTGELFFHKNQPSGIEMNELSGGTFVLQVIMGEQVYSGTFIVKK